MYVVAVSVCIRESLYIPKVKLSDKLGNAVWPRLKEFILGQCPNTNEVGTMQGRIQGGGLWGL